MYKTLMGAACLAAFAPAQTLLAATPDSQSAEIQPLIQDFEKRLEAAERKAEKAEAEAKRARRAAKPVARANAFNPAISLILNAGVASYSQEPEDYRLPGFALGEEAGLDPEGFSLGESEITISSNTDQYWRGQLTVALGNEDGETVTEVEEAYVETLGLGQGLTVRAGRFFSGLGYLNGKHAHAWNFNDAPLVYRGLFGNQLKQEGIRAAWLVPIERYLEIGLEAGNGQAFPGGGAHSGLGDWVAYARTGGDIGVSHSWQLGLSRYSADHVEGRESASHEFTGSSEINGVDFVYKWAPQGNTQTSSLVVQAEYFQRDESGEVDVDGAGTSSLDGTQEGWYLEGVYKFMQQWRVGLRYDELSSDNQGDSQAVLDAADLLSNDKPKRSSAMLEWSPSEFSRIRFQYNRDQSSRDVDDQFMMQYTQALGSHGAHSY